MNVNQMKDGPDVGSRLSSTKYKYMARVNAHHVDMSMQSMRRLSTFMAVLCAGCCEYELGACVLLIFVVTDTLNSQQLYPIHRPIYDAAICLSTSNEMLKRKLEKDMHGRIKSG